MALFTATTAFVATQADRISSAFSAVAGWVGNGLDAVGNWFASASDQAGNAESGGAKSQEEYDRHIRGVEEAQRELGELQGGLEEATGPRQRRPLEEAIKRLERDIKGHQKEIRQKWPDGRPQN